MDSALYRKKFYVRLGKETNLYTIVRLMRAKARQAWVSVFNPTLKRGVIGCASLLGFSHESKILVGQQWNLKMIFLKIMQLLPEPSFHAIWCKPPFQQSCALSCKNSEPASALSGRRLFEIVLQGATMQKQGAPIILFSTKVCLRWRWE